VESGLAVPKTNDLDRLFILLSVQHPSLKSLRRGLLFPTEFAVETRYPGMNATKRQAASALRWAKRVRQAVRTILGIKPKRNVNPP
jgi:hypothetical protein